MTVYPITGASLTLSPDSIETAAGVAVASTSGYPATGLGGGISVLSSRSVTKDGTVRLLVEVLMNAILQTGTATSDTILSQIKAHTVVTVPKIATDFFRKQAAGGVTTGATVLANLDYVVAILNVLTSGKSLAALPSTAYTSPIARGLLGARPLDTVSGAYGNAS